MELKDRELKDRAENIKRVIIISRYDMDKFEEKEMKEIRPIIRNLFDKSIKQNVMRNRSKIIRNKLKDKIIRDTWTLYETEEEKKERKDLEKKKEHNERVNKEIRDIMAHFEQEEDYYELKRVYNFWKNNYMGYESNSDKNRNLSLDEYLNKIETYPRDIIINLQNSDKWEIQLAIAINFISSKDTEEERVMHSNSDNMKFTSWDDANEVVDELSKSLRSKYQEKLETSMKGSDFIFDSIQLLYYKCHKKFFKRDGSYIDSPDWIKKKKSNKSKKRR